jgi:lysylphosphatidylglycerol synthetase-like protein (DUF2156 family)
MPLSPHEERILATLEEELRTEDPDLAAVFDQTLPSSLTARQFLPAVRPLLQLLAALMTLVAAGVFFADRLGVPGMAALTFAAVLPWLVCATRSAERRSHAGGRPGPQPKIAVGGERPPSRGAVPIVAEHGAMLLVVLLILGALALMPPNWRAVLGLVLTLVVLPWILLRIHRQR